MGLPICRLRGGTASNKSTQLVLPDGWTRNSPVTRERPSVIIGFLWHTERHELCHPASLICQDEEVAKKMTEHIEQAGCPVDIEEAEKTAAEDVVAQREEALAKQLEEMKRRKKKLVDPCSLK